MPGSDNPESQLRTVVAVIRGLVQGVGYRYWTREQAERLGLSGHVRNCADGAVEAVFSGSPAAVAAMIEACRQGPPGARVEDVAIARQDEARLEGPFRIQRS